MATLVAEKPRTQEDQAQRDLAERFLRLLDEWCQELEAFGKESPVLSVRALKDGKLTLVLRNGSRWIVRRSKK
jgi:hypothetical protein